MKWEIGNKLDLECSISLFFCTTNEIGCIDKREKRKKNVHFVFNFTLHVHNEHASFFKCSHVLQKESLVSNSSLETRLPKNKYLINEKRNLSIRFIFYLFIKYVNFKEILKI